MCTSMGIDILLMVKYVDFYQFKKILLRYVYYSLLLCLYDGVQAKDKTSLCVHETNILNTFSPLFFFLCSGINLILYKPLH
jgi:hypothetical protein